MELGILLPDLLLGLRRSNLGLRLLLGLLGGSLALTSNNLGTRLLGELCQDGATANGLSVGVELEERAKVAQRVLLGSVEAADAANRAQLRLNLVRVDDAGDVRVGERRARQAVATLQRS